MIPKTIHYCWFGGNPLPKLAKKCIKSWKKHCRGFDIIQWNEENFDLTSAPRYVQEAYAAKKWAFVTDYVRLQVVYDHGGIYMDTDVELIKDLSTLLSQKAFFGFENGVYVATGLGFGAEKGCQILYEMMQDYEGIPFIREDGSFDDIPCPKRNTGVLLRHGLRQDDSLQTVHECLILPSRYLCPMDYATGKIKKTSDTLSIHWFSASWFTSEQRRQYNAEKRALRRERWRYAPNRLLIRVLGEQTYNRIRNRFSRS